MGSLATLARALRHLNTSAPVLERLRTEIKDFEAEYSARIEDARKASPPQAWAEAAHRNLHNARHALQEFEIDSGHQSLLNAAREVVGGMTDSERRVRIISLRHEVEEKLAGSWRGKTALELLSGKAENVPVDALREALFHVNTHSQNNYRKITLLKRQLILVGFVVILLVIGAVMAALKERVPGIDAEGARLFAVAVFAGLLGGALSATLSSARVSARAKIPDVQRSAMITLTRTFIGAAAAIPTYAMLKGGLLEITANNNYALLFFCFLSGFSERWFLERIGKSGDKGGAPNSE